MKKQIITNRQVDFTFESEPCLLMREIVGSTTKEQNGITKYVIQTSQCNWVDYEVNTYDENNEIIVDEEGNPIMETKQSLKILAIKQKDGVLPVDKVTSDALYGAIKSQIILGDSFYDFQQQVELLALLVETQMKTPYGTNAEDWEIYNAE